MKSPTTRKTSAAKAQPHVAWRANARISAKLAQHGCSVVGLLADFAKDPQIDPALRLQAIEHLAMLQYRACEPTPKPASGTAPEAAGPVDIGAAIAANWAKDE